MPSVCLSVYLHLYIHTYLYNKHLLFYTLSVMATTTVAAAAYCIFISRCRLQTHYSSPAASASAPVCRTEMMVVVFFSENKCVRYSTNFKHTYLLHIVREFISFVYYRIIGYTFTYVSHRIASHRVMYECMYVHIKKKHVAYYMYMYNTPRTINNNNNKYVIQKHKIYIQQLSTYVCLRIQCSLFTIVPSSWYAQNM